MNLLKKSFLFSLLLIIVMGFKPKNEIQDMVRISIEAPGYMTNTLKILTYKQLSMEQYDLAEIKLDVDGKGMIEFSISKPQFVSLQTGEQINTLYLEPGYEMKISIDENIDKPFQFTGIGAEANNYLANTSLIKRKIVETNGKNIYELDEVSFLHRLDSLQNSLSDFHKNYTDHVKLPEYLIVLLNKMNTILTLSIKQIYGWNYATQSESFHIPENLNVNDKIPFDPALLNIKMREYGDIFHILMHLKFYIPLFADNTPEEIEKLRSKSVIFVKEAISKTEYPEFIKDLFYAKNIDYWLGLYGITPEIETVYNQFKNEYPTSAYLAELDMHYKKWLRISAGQPAPDFSGFSLTGEKISLSDLRGKIVYIDVWATWCKPCLQELPYGKELQKKFIGNDEVVFLYVSLDEDQEVLKKTISENQQANVLHMISDDSISQPYLIWGIPRFILIDQYGKIVKPFALHPSSGKIADEIEQLLTKK